MPPGDRDGTAPVSLGRYVAAAAREQTLVVQPRMGMSDPVEMRAGLRATRMATGRTAGTITIDSYTRVSAEDSARRLVGRSVPLNGYPITVHEPAVTQAVLDGLHTPDFPIQVRHGSASPQPIIEAMTRVGLNATEGGPVSYCLPYGRMPLRQSVENWRASVEYLAGTRSAGSEPHLETFGGCLMGQLCPPGLLVATSALEALFFYRHGMRSISLSYAQQTDPDQDVEAIAALRRLAAELLSGAEWHVVVYTYMGMYPRTPVGAMRLLAESAVLAVRGGAARLIVKSAAEAHRIPTTAENVAALETAAAAARRAPSPGSDDGGEVYAEARTLVDAVLNLHHDLGAALLRAFARGYLDVPFCLHPDNAGQARSYLDAAGRLRWAAVGAMPLPVRRGGPDRRLRSAELLNALSFMRRRYDEPPAPGRDDRAGSANPPVRDTIRSS